MMDILKAYLVLLSVIAVLLWLVIYTFRETRSKTIDVSADIYNWMHVKKSYWVCTECETELGDRKIPCIDCGYDTDRYRVKSKRTKKAA